MRYAEPQLEVESSLVDPSAYHTAFWVPCLSHGWYCYVRPCPAGPRGGQGLPAMYVLGLGWGGRHVPPPNAIPSSLYVPTLTATPSAGLWLGLAELQPHSGGCSSGSSCRSQPRPRRRGRRLRSGQPQPQPPIMEGVAFGVADHPNRNCTVAVAIGMGSTPTPCWEVGGFVDPNRNPRLGVAVEIGATPTPTPTLGLGSALLLIPTATPLLGLQLGRG